jgi:hypothetical protein
VWRAAGRRRSHRHSTYILRFRVVTERNAA